MPEPFNADVWVGADRGVWRTEAGELVKIHHMSRPFIVKVVQYIRDKDEFWEHSRVYNALLRELKKRRKSDERDDGRKH